MLQGNSAIAASFSFLAAIAIVVVAASPRLSRLTPQRQAAACAAASILAPKEAAAHTPMASSVKR